MDITIFNTYNDLELYLLKLKRKDLQSICKLYNIPANIKNIDMIIRILDQSKLKKLDECTQNINNNEDKIELNQNTLESSLNKDILNDQYDYIDIQITRSPNNNYGLNISSLIEHFDYEGVDDDISIDNYETKTCEIEIIDIGEKDLTPNSKKRKLKHASTALPAPRIFVSPVSRAPKSQTRGILSSAMKSHSEYKKKLTWSNHSRIRLIDNCLDATAFEAAKREFKSRPDSNKKVKISPRSRLILSKHFSKSPSASPIPDFIVPIAVAENSYSNNFEPVQLWATSTSLDTKLAEVSVSPSPVKFSFEEFKDPLINSPDEKKENYVNSIFNSARRISGEFINRISFGGFK